ncbi:hypothetical protein SD78_3168 [Bacillus badius]|nr:hypothetical protein SD78_3168 [Bacillus badius]
MLFKLSLTNYKFNIRLIEVHSFDEENNPYIYKVLTIIK